MVLGGPIYETRGPRTMFRIYGGVSFGYILVLLAFMIFIGMRKRLTSTEEVAGLLNYFATQFFVIVSTSFRFSVEARVLNKNVLCCLSASQLQGFRCHAESDGVCTWVTIRPNFFGLNSLAKPSVN